jgi:hypothetical protein
VSYYSGDMRSSITAKAFLIESPIIVLVRKEVFVVRVVSLLGVEVLAEAFLIAMHINFSSIINNATVAAS